jgi:protoporphyrinogen oxidase
MNEILILGAGPAGMAAALELSRAGKKLAVIEKSSQVGGLAKTLRFGEFKTDIGPHRFFSKNTALYDFIEDLLGDKWQPVQRLTRFYINGKFFLYPVKLANVLSKVSPLFSFRILLDYLYERLRAKIRPREINSFEDYVVSNFGRTLAEFNMLNYTEKIWGIPASQISKLQGEQRLKSLSPWEIVKKALNPKKSRARSLTEVFHYPREGSGSIYETMAKKVQEAGNKIFLNSTATRLHHQDHRLTEVKLNLEGEEQTIRPDWVVTSIPIAELIKLLDPPAPKEVLEAAKSLRWRSQRYLFITLNRESITKDNWLYFHEKEIPFGRVCEPRNMSPHLSPKGKTSLFIEFCTFKDGPVWQMTADELFELAYPHLNRIFGIEKEEVINKYTHAIEYVYPLYDINYENRLQKVKDYLDQFENLIYIGRPGRFAWTNQDHSLEMGILAAKKIVEKKDINFDKIGGEKEYFEKGDAQLSSNLN